MKTLPTDSPEALARVLAMMIVTDAELDPRELDMLEELDAFGRIGIEREGFRATAQQYCAELGARMGDRAWLQLSDVMLIDEILRPVQGAAQLLLVARLCAAIITADGRVHDIERLVFDHMLARWGLTRAAVSRAILADRRQVA